MQNKVKVYFVQLGDDSRQIRQLDEERRRLREYNTVLENLVAEKDLADRDTLNSELKKANEKILSLEEALSVSFNRPKNIEHSQLII